MGLVDYDSEPESESTSPSSKPVPTAKAADLHLKKTAKRPLPALPGTFDFGVGPKDDPAQHQGRKRTRPYIDGDYDTHIYLSLPIPAKLRREIEGYCSSVTIACPELELHGMLESSSDLHISLSHAFPLRQYQIASFKARLADCLLKSKSSSFHASLAGRVKVYYNGRRYGGDGHGGRAFLALRVGAGGKEIDEIVQNALHPLLREFHRPLYHTQPEYHASFAWCLTDSVTESDSRDELSSDWPGDLKDPSDSTAGSSRLITFPIGDETIDSLNGTWERRILAAQPRMGWRIDNFVLKIGKDVTLIPLHT